MGWSGYVPEKILEVFKDDPEMMDLLRNYGMTKKHGNLPDNYLWLVIHGQQREIKKLKEELSYQETYFANALELMKKKTPG